MATDDLHPQVVIPHGIVPSSDDQAFSSSGIFLLHKVCVILGILVTHEVVYDPQLAAGEVAPGPYDLVDDFGRDPDFPGIEGSPACLDLPSLFLCGRISGQRKSRGIFILCSVHILCIFFT